MSATTVWLAQTAQGSADGSSAANARAASYFNSSGNWGVGATQIGAGTVVRLTGSVSTNLTFQGSGSSGSPITLDGSSATYSGIVDTNNKAWWVIQNVTWASGMADGTFGFITLNGTNGVLTGCTADNFIGNCVFITQFGGNVRPDTILISNCFFRTTTSTTLGDVEVDIIRTEGAINVTIEKCHLEMRVGGAGTGGNEHDDCIQTYEKGGSSGGPPANWTIRHNKIIMNSPTSFNRSWLMLEGMAGTNYIYNNLFLGLQGADIANGISSSGNQTGVVFNVMYNTFVTKAGAGNNVISFYAPGTCNLRGNVVYCVDAGTMLGPASGAMTYNRSYNIWFGENTPSISGITGELIQDPLFVDYANNDFRLTNSSPAKANGINLGSPYNKYFARTTSWPTNVLLATRHATNQWTRGCLGANITAPTNLAAV